MDFTPETVMQLPKRASARVRSEALDWINTTYQHKGVVADDFNEAGQPKVMIRLAHKDGRIVPGQVGIEDFLPFVKPVRFPVHHIPTGRGPQTIESTLIPAIITAKSRRDMGPVSYGLWAPEHPLVQQLIGKYVVVYREQNGDPDLRWVFAGHRDGIGTALDLMFSKHIGGA